MCVPGWPEVLVENATQTYPKTFTFYKVLQVILMQVAHDAPQYLEKQYHTLFYLI